MRSKRGSTLLLTICLFMVFLIFAAALIPLSRRAFQQTAADVTQQQADYIAQSAVEALITQLDEESLRQTLIEVVEESKDQVVIGPAMAIMVNTDILSLGMHFIMNLTVGFCGLRAGYLLLQRQNMKIKHLR